VKNQLVAEIEPSLSRRDGIGSSVRLLPLVGTWRAKSGSCMVDKIDVEDYLLNARDGQLQLDLEIAG